MRASAPHRRLLLAVKADNDGGLLEYILAAVAAEPVAVHLREHTRLLRTGEADAALMFEPYDPAGIDVDVVAVEPRVAALSADHPLARASRYGWPISASPLGTSVNGRSATSASKVHTIWRSCSRSSVSERK